MIVTRRGSNDRFFTQFIPNFAKACMASFTRFEVPFKFNAINFLPISYSGRKPTSHLFPRLATNRAATKESMQCFSCTLSVSLDIYLNYYFVNSEVGQSNATTMVATNLPFVGAPFVGAPRDRDSTFLKVKRWPTMVTLNTIFFHFTQPREKLGIPR